MNDLIVIPENKTQLLDVFIEAKDFSREMDNIRAQAKDLPTDMTVRKNREEVASFAYKVAKAKAAIEKAGAGLSAEYKEIPKKIDATRREYKQAFEALQVEVRAPLTEWESAEQARKDAHELAINEMKRVLDCDYAHSDEVFGLLAHVEGLAIGENFEEYEAEAHRVKADEIGRASCRERV